MRQKTITGQKKSRQENPQLLPKRKRIFLLITFILPFLIVALLEIGLRIFNYGEDYPLFVSTPTENSKFYGLNLEVARPYFSTLSDLPSPRKDLFLKEKPKNGYRIFVLGESSAAGFPYGNNITFSRILNNRLSDAFPEKHIEIINTALTAINTYTELEFVDEILKYQPDAILIYTGHNEYYGAMGVASMESLGKSRWIVKTALALRKFKTYELISDLIGGIKNIFSSSPNNQFEDPSATLMERIVKEDIIPFNSEDYELGKNQFRENLSEIIEKAKDAGVQVIVSELVSNVRDNAPFESVESNGLPSAHEIFNQAIELEKAGKFEEAKSAYYKAKDFDALRFRAPEDFNKIIHEVASEYGIPVVPMKNYFESNSPNGLIGNNLMCEHLHPNIDGYFLMANAFFDVIHNEKLISPEWNENKIKQPSFYRNNWGYTALDSSYAALSVMRLKGGWPFEKNHSPNLALQNFKPTNKVDSIATDILTTANITLEQGHINLAEYFESVGQLDQAFKEYNALIYTVPYTSLFYEPAVRVLVKMGWYGKAMEILFKSLKYEETAFAYQWIGQIFLMDDQTAKGISYLNKAREIEPKNSVLLFNLSRAYYKLSKFNEGDIILDQLKNVADQSLISKLETIRKQSHEQF